MKITGLNAAARQMIRAHGVTVADYVAHFQDSCNFSSAGGAWGGDVCGCIDDRCANGYHHLGVDDCGCLPMLLREMLNAQRQ
jgi:hypothetical protein